MTTQLSKTGQAVINNFITQQKVANYYELQ
jgi:hypothetical protein